MEFYLTAILSASTFEVLNNIMEEAAFDESITSAEYEELYRMALEKAREAA